MIDTSKRDIIIGWCNRCNQYFHNGGVVCKTCVDAIQAKLDVVIQENARLQEKIKTYGEMEFDYLFTRPETAKILELERLQKNQAATIKSYQEDHQRLHAIIATRESELKTLNNEVEHLRKIVYANPIA